MAEFMIILRSLVSKFRQLHDKLKTKIFCKSAPVYERIYTIVVMQAYCSVR